MENLEILKRIRELEQEYYQRFGKEIDYSVIPPGLTQEKLVDVLERIKDIGESILVGFSYIQKKVNKKTF